MPGFGMGAWGEIAWLAIITVGGGLILRKLNELCRPPALGSRKCPHCDQRIPDIGSYCPLCGQRIT